MIKPADALIALAAVGAFSPAAAQRTDTVKVGIGEAVAYALRASDEAQIARLNLEVSDANFGVARASILPQVGFTGTYSQVIQNARATIVNPAVFGQSYTYQGTFRATQTFIQGGRLVFGARGASRSREAAEFDIGETRARLAVDMQRSYLNALYLARIAELQERNLALSTERLRQVQQLNSAGRSSRFDLLRAQVDRANIEPLVLQARNDRENALLDTKRLLDIPMERPLVLSTVLDTGMVRQVVDAAAADLAPDPLRGSVRSAELSLLAREDAQRVVRAGLFPTVSMNFNYGYLALPSQNGLPDRFGVSSHALCPSTASATQFCQNNGFFPDRSFGMTVTWNVFDGLLTKANLDAAGAQRRIAETTLHQAREAAALDLARARGEFDRARAAWTARAETANQAEEAYQLAALRFSKGLGTQLEVSDAQVQLLTARSNEARGLYDVFLATAELARVRGRPIPLPTGGSVQVRSSSGLIPSASNSR